MKLFNLAVLFCGLIIFGARSAAISESTTYDKVVVYGTMTCPYTSGLRNFFLQNDIEYIFKDINNHQGASTEMWDVVNASSWYSGGSISLPIVDINNDIYERPDNDYLLSIINSGNGVISSDETGSVSGLIKNSLGEGIIAEINLSRISDLSEYWHICKSYTQGEFACHGVEPGQYKAAIRYNSLISNYIFLNSYINSGQKYLVLAQDNIDTGLTTILGNSTNATLILPYYPYPSDIYWINNIDQTINLFIFLTYGNLWAINYLYDTVEKVVSDYGYMNEIQYSSTKKILGTLSQTNRKIYIIDADPLSETFLDVIQTVENLPIQPTDLQFNQAGDMAYVGCNGGQSVAVVDVNTGSITSTINLSGYTQDIVLDEPMKRAYACVYSGLLYPLNQLAVIDIDPRSSTYWDVLKYIPIGSSGCYNQYLSYPYIYSQSRVGIDKVDISTDAVESFISTNTSPYMSLNKDAKKIYYIDHDDKVLQNFEINVFDLDNEKDMQSSILPAGHNYFNLDMSDDKSTLIVHSNEREIYTFSIKEDGTLVIPQNTLEPVEVCGGANEVLSFGVSAGENLLCTATNSITLLSAFRVENGGSFQGKIAE